MKTRNKVLLTLACAVLLVTASVMGTLAWLTSTGTVTNTFTVGQVKITLDEAKVNEYGVKLNDKNEVATGSDTLASRVNGNEYKLIPGHTYVKDPTIHVQANSEECYLFVKVENGLKDILDSQTIETQMGENGWKALTGSNGVYYYAGKAEAEEAGTENMQSVAENTDVVIFEYFKLKGADVTATTLESYGQSTPITVTAYAIQTDGFAADAPQAAWSALNP